MKTEADRAVRAEERRHLEALQNIMKRWPEYRSQFAYAMLGQAIALCDSFGLDVDGFIRELRKREPMPPVLVPPKGSSS